jgi:Protein of unknown function (DUF1236)
MQSAILAARDAWNDLLRTFVDTGPTQSSTSGRIFERLGAPQRRGVREGAPRRAGAEFELQIGAAVPRQTELHDLPPEVAEAMSGYWDDQYVLVRDTMVIVDRNSRRVAAIVPGAG